MTIGVGEAPLNVASAYAEREWTVDESQHIEDDSVDDDENRTSTEGEEVDEGEEPEVDDSEEEEPEPEVDETVDETEEKPAGFEIPTDLAGKTPEELAKIVLDQRTFTGRQSSEVGDLRKLIEEQQGTIDQLTSSFQQIQTESTAGYFDQHGLENPAQTYQQMLGLLGSKQLQVGEVEKFIDRVYNEVDSDLGRAMDRDFITRMSRAEVMQHVQPIQRQNYEAMLESVTDDLYNSTDPATAADVQEYEKEVLGILQPVLTSGVPLGSNASEVRARLDAALQLARGQDPTRSYAYKQALATRRVTANVEAGSAPPEPPPTVQQAARQAIFEHRKADPADMMLAPLTSFHKK